MHEYITLVIQEEEVCEVECGCAHSEQGQPGPWGAWGPCRSGARSRTRQLLVPARRRCNVPSRSVVFSKPLRKITNIIQYPCSLSPGNHESKINSWYCIFSHQHLVNTTLRLRLLSWCFQILSHLWILIDLTTIILVNLMQIRNNWMGQLHRWTGRDTWPAGHRTPWG